MGHSHIIENEMRDLRAGYVDETIRGLFARECQLLGLLQSICPLQERVEGVTTMTHRMRRAERLLGDVYAAGDRSCSAYDALSMISDDIGEFEDAISRVLYQITMLPPVQRTGIIEIYGTEIAADAVMSAVREFHPGAEIQGVDAVDFSNGYAAMAENLSRKSDLARSTSPIISAVGWSADL